MPGMKQPNDEPDKGIAALVSIVLVGVMLIVGLLYWATAAELAQTRAPPVAGGGIANFSGATTGQR